MTRRILVLAALLLASGLSARLYGDTCYLLRARESVPALLGVEGGKGTGQVLIVLQPKDCLRSGELVERWKALHRHGTVPVTVLVVGSGALAREQRNAFAEHDASLPLRRLRMLDARIVAEKLGYASTPFAVVLDREGRVAASFPGMQNVPAEALEALVRQAEEQARLQTGE